MPVLGGKSAVAAVPRRRPSLIFEVVSKPGAGSQLTGRSVSLRARGSDFFTHAHRSCGRRPSPIIPKEACQVLAKTQDNEEIIERVAALDIGKAELMCCVRVPDEDHAGKRLPEVESYSTMTRPLLGRADRLACLGVTRVVMEATSDYWKPCFTCWRPPGSRPGWSTPRTSSTCPGGPRPTNWIASGCARSPSGR